MSTQLTYAELDRRAALVAARLTEHGVGPESLVAVALSRSIELVVGLLAVVRAGAGYLPLDVAYPTERLRFMLDDAGPAAVLTSADMASAVPEYAAPVVLVEDCVDVAAPTASRSGGAGRAAGQRRLRDLHLRIHRPPQGGGGQPSGRGHVVHQRGRAIRLRPRRRVDDVPFVCLRFRGVGNVGRVAVRWQAGRRRLRHIPVAGGVRGCRGAGARDGVEPDPVGVLRVRRCGARVSRIRLYQLVISRCDMSFSVVRHWNPSRLDRLVRGARAGIAAIGEHVRDHRDDRACDVLRDRSGERAAGIGSPLPGLRVYVLDDRLHPVPIGVAGEIYVAGGQLSRGYLGAPALTRGPIRGEPVRSGRRPVVSDREISAGGRSPRADWSWLYVGRADAQVQLRGFRIELGEVEAALLRHPCVTQAAVAVHRHDRGVDQLIGYVVGIDGQQVDAGRSPGCRCAGV